MISPATRQRSSRLPLIRRALWRSALLLVLLLHIPATAKVFAVALEGEPSWSSLLLISATNIFFVLEIIFARSLRLLTDRRSIIAFVLVVALIHVGVIDCGFPDFALEHNFHFWLIFTVGGFAARQWLLSRLIPCLRDFTRRTIERQRWLARLRYGATIAPIPAMRRPDRGWLSAPLRAPPHVSI